MIEFIAILEERERRRICLERIFATGLSAEEYGRYYSENFRKGPVAKSSGDSEKIQNCKTFAIERVFRI